MCNVCLLKCLAVLHFSWANICILPNFPTPRLSGSEILLLRRQCLFILHRQYRSCWCLDESSSHVYVIDLVLAEYAGFSTKMVHMPVSESLIDCVPTHIIWQDEPKCKLANTAWGAYFHHDNTCIYSVCEHSLLMHTLACSETYRLVRFVCALSVAVYH